MRVLVFGDSIAQGFWDTESGWVARLRRHYDEKQLKDLKNNIGKYAIVCSSQTCWRV